MINWLFICRLCQSKYRCIGGHRFEVAYGSADDLPNRDLKGSEEHKTVSLVI